MRRLVWLPVLVLLLLVSGCGGGDDEPDQEAAAPTTSATPTAPATPVQDVPQVGACYALDFKGATSATTAVPPVPCTAKHTAVTIYVGTIDAIDDGHLLGIDSATVQDQLATTCPTKVAPWVGGDPDKQRLSRFSAVWFGPTLKDADAGAKWFRCDLVAVGGDDTLAALDGDAKNALAPDDALDRWGTCGTAAPSEKGFERVVCSAKHSWQAVSVVAIDKDAAYLGKGAQAAADDACKLEAQQRATDPLVYKWSFEWPPRDDWNAGQRSGLCWVPAS